MNKLDKYFEELLIYMASQIEENASTLHNTTFNFNLFHSIQTDNKEVKDGEDLISLKSIIKINDNKIIEKILMKALNEKCIEYTTMSGGNFNSIGLTENGFRRYKAIKLNRKENKKIFFTYPIDKIIIPILISLITAVLASYITSNIQNTKLNEEIQNLRKDIEWIKLNK
ncbi:MAG: hypothetical protein U9Q30_07380 [Campylobacterota bacterium]|nr:hypothetical protein [Campylobacterota bacterium]